MNEPVLNLSSGPVLNLVSGLFLNLSSGLVLYLSSGPILNQCSGLILNLSSGLVLYLSSGPTLNLSSGLILNLRWNLKLGILVSICSSAHPFVFSLNRFRFPSDSFLLPDLKTGDKLEDEWTDGGIKDWWINRFTKYKDEHLKSMMYRNLFFNLKVSNFWSKVKS